MQRFRVDKTQIQANFASSIAEDKIICDDGKIIDMKQEMTF